MHANTHNKEAAVASKSAADITTPWSLLESWNLIGVKSEALTDSRAADFVCLRKSSHKSKRLSQKLESSLDDYATCGHEILSGSTASLFIECGFPLFSCSFSV